jgi:hypothetical protein
MLNTDPRTFTVTLGKFARENEDAVLTVVPTEKSMGEKVSPTSVVERDTTPTWRLVTTTLAPER